MSIFYKKLEHTEHRLHMEHVIYADGLIRKSRISAPPQQTKRTAEETKASKATKANGKDAPGSGNSSSIQGALYDNYEIMLHYLTVNVSKFV
jgi:hypothetical protein